MVTLLKLLKIWKDVIFFVHTKVPREIPYVSHGQNIEMIQVLHFS